MRKLSDEVRQDAESGIRYRATIWEHDNHVIEVNSDQFGHHVRIDGDSKTARINLSNNGLIGFMFKVFGGRR